MGATWWAGVREQEVGKRSKKKELEKRVIGLFIGSSPRLGQLDTSKKWGYTAFVDTKKESQMMVLC